MNFLAIGSIIGLVMGLTGSGGALVAIPLFMYILDLGLKEASVLSLVAVLLASSINFISVRNDAFIKTAFVMFLASLVGSYSSVPLKGIIPDLVIALLLAAISIFSLAMMWWKKRGEKKDSVKKAGTTLEVISGLILGVLTTLTGLGGGVLLMPMLVGPFKLDQKRAVATSLLTIFLSSTASLFFQVSKGFSIPDLPSILYLSAGIIASALILKQITKKIQVNHLELTRKIVFTLVVILALVKIF